MPEVSRFYGIAIKMYFDEHLPPHFHAEYGEYEALINIHTLAVIAGNLPSRALGLVVEWASLRQAELGEVWERARNMEPLGKIAPLK
ncbi:MAG: DUF4160 domain-containing protein [Thermoflexales bacterium]|nr:DUF4160 domain-containing protein [Thermoflexales bacterium]